MTSIINSRTDIEFQKLVDKLEQTEITMKLEETENLKLQYVINIQTTTSQINHIRDSDNTENRNCGIIIVKLQMTKAKQKIRFQ